VTITGHYCRECVAPWGVVGNKWSSTDQLHRAATDLFVDWWQERWEWQRSTDPTLEYAHPRAPEYVPPIGIVRVVWITEANARWLEDVTGIGVGVDAPCWVIAGEAEVPNWWAIPRSKPGANIKRCLCLGRLPEPKALHWRHNTQFLTGTVLGMSTPLEEV
jgi:hypothetical protein